MDIVTYDQYNEALRYEVGNKAANLSILYKKGYNVPKGFALTISFFQNNPDISSNNIKLLESFKRLNVPLVVRSSAIDEDSDSKSFAGIFESVLNIVSLDGYVSAINKVCNSATSLIYKKYAKEDKPAKMALLVQELVCAEHAGVVFTANPVNNNSFEMVIEYFNGLGISVVSGKTTPQHIIVDKGSHKVKEDIRNDKGIAYFPDSNGGCKEFFIGEEKVTRIDGFMLEEIIKKTIEIEKIFDYPQDIEWAVSNGKLFIIQARPITGLSRSVR